MAARSHVPDFAGPDATPGLAVLGCSHRLAVGRVRRLECRGTAFRPAVGQDRVRCVHSLRGGTRLARSAEGEQFVAIRPHVQKMNRCERDMTNGRLVGIPDKWICQHKTGTRNVKSGADVALRSDVG